MDESTMKIVKSCLHYSLLCLFPVRQTFYPLLVVNPWIRVTNWKCIIIRYSWRKLYFAEILLVPQMCKIGLSFLSIQKMAFKRNSSESYLWNVAQLIQALQSSLLSVKIILQFHGQNYVFESFATQVQCLFSIQVVDQFRISLRPS